MVNRVIHLGKTSLGPTYVGPLDLYGSAAVAWSTRALSAAFLGQNIARVVNPATHAGADYTAIVGTGLLDTASIVTALSGGNGRYTKLYDQSGHANHLSGPVSIPENNAPDFDASIVGLKFVDTAPQMASVSAVTLTQPFAVSLVASQGNVSGNSNMFQSSDTPRIGQRAGSYAYIDTNSGEVPRNSTFNAQSTFYSVQALFNGASSKLLVNGVPATLDGNAGTGNNSSIVLLGQIWHSATADSPGYIKEFIMWNSDPGDTLRTAIESNQRTYWGF